MPRLSVFNNITLDGYAAGPQGDISWAHTAPPDPDFDALVASNASSEGTLLMGRITYDMMARYWPTPAAVQANPVVAKGMNNRSKIVFSRSLKTATWANTQVVSGDIVQAVRNMKQSNGPDMVILGSLSIVPQLADLIDEFQVVVNPVAIGAGRTMFEHVHSRLNLTGSHTFPSGKVFLSYQSTR